MAVDCGGISRRARAPMTGANIGSRPAHLPTLTPLRGIAALLVVLMHLSGTLLPNLDTARYTLVLENGYLAVDLFFLMSGVVIAHVYGSTLGAGPSLAGTATFLRARFARLYPLHFCTLAYLVLVHLIIHAVISVVHGQPFQFPWDGRHSINAAFANLLMIHGIWNDHSTWNYPSWSISTEFVAYLTFPVIAPLLAWQRRHMAIIAIAVLFAGLWWLAASHGGLAINTGPSVVRCVLQFGIGTLLYRLYLDGVGRRLLARDTTFAIAAAAVVLGLHLGWADILIVLVFMVLILAGIQNQGRVRELASARPLVWCGNISFSLYMTHGIIDELARILFGLTTGVPDGRSLGAAESLVALAAALVLVFIVSDFTYRRIEVPCRRWLNGVPRKRAGPGSHLTSSAVPALCPVGPGFDDRSSPACEAHGDAAGQAGRPRNG